MSADGKRTAPGFAEVFHPVPGHRTQYEVIDQITFAIRAGVFAPGDRLPSLDELSALLGVSRSVVIEAVRSLSMAGVIATQRGNRGGLTVATSNIPVALLGLTANKFDKLPDILEARRAVEVQLALLCAQRATPDDFDAMELSVLRLVESRDADRLERRHWDHLFHYQMARAARSEVLAYMQHQILERLTVVLESYFREDEDPLAVESLHRETLDCLRTGDPELIMRAVERHLAPLELLVQQPSPADTPSRK
ncbi:GntR family transcriptional regulator, transcriptional repressor for pyruvate dehydrogenase complex [Micromonospora rhizosphaerae]|uniref:GntR family transcriptional regulator, transcriptional repressor for pyruvate dehydrogenase complex n=1 Tax=Micromonospora rhizosphaerae TaxID=568872 RepID=A0A1C6SBV8_9ACTN|nr:FCD domain-containing protein [Micromonospora rhizosphaerae]SCL26897.1 GntR family transcriptional regulator, transcriptional repressor for pyruvate dehydrogenase complex [Micromonospora rhizosphaerae]